MSKYKIDPGVATGDDVKKIFSLAKEKAFALPAVNVVGTNSINAVLETAAKLNSPVIIQFSNGGAHFNAAKKLLPWIDGLLKANKENLDRNGKTLFSSHMIDLSEEPLIENIEICKKYLAKMSRMGMTLEIELGVTGGEEDGVDNTDIDSSKLYTQPEEVAYAYEELIKISDKFIIAAAFGNVHGVYKPGNVLLTPKILKNSQEYISKKFGVKKNTIDFVFHGGSGSSIDEIREAIDYGVVKMNIDTDLQYAYMTGVRDYFNLNKDYLKSQIGNPEGSDLPNKKIYDPRVWLREGEKSFVTRLEKAFYDLNNVNTL